MTALASRRCAVSIWAVVASWPPSPGPPARRGTPTTTEDAEFAAPGQGMDDPARLLEPAGLRTCRGARGCRRRRTCWATTSASRSGSPTPPSQQAYFKALEKALPGRVRTIVGRAVRGRTRHPGGLHLVGGQPQEPRDQPAATSAGWPIRAACHRPRPQSLVAATKPHYHISAGLHSAETSPPEAVIELVYRLAVSEEPYIRKIRDNLIVSVTPDDRPRRPRSRGGLVQRLQGRRGLRRRRELRRPALLGQVRLPRQQPRHQLRRGLAARPPGVVPALGPAGVARPPRGPGAALHLQRAAAAERQPRPDPLHASCRSSPPTRSTSSPATACRACGTSASWTCGRPATSASPPPTTTACCGCTRSSTRAAPTPRRRGSRARS